MTISARLDTLLQHIFPAEDVPATGLTMMRRFFVRKSREGNVYLHHFIRQDNSESAHDHPWHFVSLMLKGSYLETVFDHGMVTSRRRYSAPCFLFRNRNTIHKLTEIAPDTWTFVLTSKWLGRWGYWDAAGKWTYHKDVHTQRVEQEKLWAAAKKASVVRGSVAAPTLHVLAEAELKGLPARRPFLRAVPGLPPV